VSALAVTLTTEQLADLVRSAVRAELAEQRPQPLAAVLNSDEAAQFLKMPIDTLRKRVRKGEIPSFKIGALLRFRVSELEAFVKEAK